MKHIHINYILKQLHNYKDYNNLKKIVQISIDAFDLINKNEFMYNVDKNIPSELIGDSVMIQRIIMGLLIILHLKMNLKQIALEI